MILGDEVKEFEDLVSISRAQALDDPVGEDPPPITPNPRIMERDDPVRRGNTQDPQRKVLYRIEREGVIVANTYMEKVAESFSALRGFRGNFRLDLLYKNIRIINVKEPCIISYSYSLAKWFFICKLNIK